MVSGDVNAIYVKKMVDKYMTELLFIAEKKGSTVFDFGPFGKLY